MIYSITSTKTDTPDATRERGAIFQFFKVKQIVYEKSLKDMFTKKVIMV